MTANKLLPKDIQRLTADERAMSGNVSLRLPSALSSLHTVHPLLYLIRTHGVKLRLVYHSGQAHFRATKYIGYFRFWNDIVLRTSVL